jgi:hypothetical protein
MNSKTLLFAKRGVRDIELSGSELQHSPVPGDIPAFFQHLPALFRPYSVNVP